MNIPDLIFENLVSVFCDEKYLNSLMRIRDLVNPDPGDPGWKKSGSGINIPDPQHWFFRLDQSSLLLYPSVIKPDFLVTYIRWSPGSDRNERLPDILGDGGVHQLEHLEVVAVLFNPGHQPGLSHHLSHSHNFSAPDNLQNGKFWDSHQPYEAYKLRDENRSTKTSSNTFLLYNLGFFLIRTLWNIKIK